jgi:hypothetical protein
VHDVLIEANKHDINLSALFDEFLSDHPSWRKVFPTGEELAEVFHRFSRNGIAHPQWRTPTRAEIETMLEHIRSHGELQSLKDGKRQEDPLKDAEKLIDAAELYEKERPRVRASA